MAGQWAVGEYNLKVAPDGKFTLGVIDGKVVSGTFTASDNSDYPATDNWLKAQDPKFKVTAYIRSTAGNLEIQRVCNAGAKDCSSARLSGKIIDPGTYEVIYEINLPPQSHPAAHNDSLKHPLCKRDGTQ